MTTEPNAADFCDIACELIRAALLIDGSEDGEIRAAVALITLRLDVDPAWIPAVAGRVARAAAGRVNSSTFDPAGAEEILKVCAETIESAAQNDDTAIPSRVKAARAALRAAQADSDDKVLALVDYWRWFEQRALLHSYVSAGVILIRACANFAGGDAVLEELLKQFEDEKARHTRAYEETEGSE